MRRRELKNMEWGLLVVAIILSIIGIVALFSATQETEYDEFKKQIIWFAVSLIVMVIVSQGTFIPVPGSNINALHIAGASDTLYSLITGGNYGTIFAMGIGPYITASIIMQLLTVAIPTLEQIH